MRSLSYSSFPIIFLLLSLLFVTSFASLVFDYRTSKCNNASAYTDGSIYSSNLNTVLNYLIQKGSQSGFNISSYGQSPNKVYGFLQCYGNISAQDCSDCSKEAKSRLQKYCPNDIGGQVWMLYCYLRYDNSSFVSKLDIHGETIINPDKVTSSVEAFKSLKAGLLSNLSETASKPASKGFAIGSANYSASNTVYGLVQCWRDLSLNDCSSCLAAATVALAICCSTNVGAHVMLASCTVRYEIYYFTEPWEESSSPSPSSLPKGSSPPNSSTSAETPTNGAFLLTEPKKKSSKRLPIILGTLGGVILAVVICMFVLRRKPKSTNLGEPEIAITHHKERHDYTAETQLLSKKFSLKTLIEATHNFHPDNKLGEGGFGAVYRGTTKDGNDIAVKKLSAKSSQGENEFMNEVHLVASIQHRNLVKMLGCCVEGNERLLVYEFLPNKSLDSFLFDPEKRKRLDWEKRYNIIIGIVRGLFYLHEESQLRIIHRDVKASNILLDDKLNPKIADFGLARLFPEDETHIQTRVAGTYGYMAPEYAMRGQLSVKADVYSFGVLLLEILSGRKNTENYRSEEMQSLLEWLWSLYKRGDVLSMVDSMLVQNCPQEQAQRCIHVGLLCVQANASLRPIMSNVLKMICDDSETVPNPTKPAFVISGQNPESNSMPSYAKEVSPDTSGASSTPLRFSSVNDTSISDLKPR